jgi:UDP-N-acetylglucosamine:LPS N-acetylglucosamine transferase
VDRTPSILFAISDTGGGHRAGAVAISAAIEQALNAGVERHIVDLLTTTGVPLFRDAPGLYNRLTTRWLPIFDFAYQLTDGRRRIDALMQVVYLQAHRNIVRALTETRPALVVSVHPLANRLIGNTRRNYRLNFRFITVVTDLVSLHAAWADPDAELCIVPTGEAYERMRKIGMPENKLIRTGFPVHPKFTTYQGTPRAARAALGVDLEPFTVLVTSGGVGGGNMRELVTALDRAYPAQQFLVITGRNTALREQLQALGLGPNVHIYGFVDNMEEMMAASDIIVTKAGPGTLMEALAMRRPVIVTQAVGMQERGNIDFVLNYELGAFCPTVERIVAAIGELIDPATYTATVERLADAVPRDGATQIGRILLDQLREEPPRIRRRLQLPSVATLRQLGARVPRLPAIAARRGAGKPKRRLRLPAVRRLPRWRRTRGA